MSDNRSEEIIFNEIISLVNNNNLDQAEEIIQKTLQQLNYKDHFFLFFLLGIINEKKKKIELSKNYFEKVIEINKNFILAYYNLGLIYFKEKSYSRANFFFKKGLEVDPNFYDCFFMMAKIKAEENKIFDSIELYKKCIELDPEKIDAYIDLSNKYIFQQEYIDAEIILKKALQKFHKSFEILNNLGLLYLKTSKLEDAKFFFTQAIISKPDEINPRLNMSVVYSEQQNYEKSLNVINETIDLDSQIPELYFFKSNILEKLSKLEESINCLDNILKLNVFFPKVFTRLIELNIKLLNQNQGKKLYENIDLKNLEVEDLELLIFNSNYIYNFEHDKYLGLINESNIKRKKNCSQQLEIFNKQKSLNSNLCNKTKIGFISADFKNHPISYQLKDFFFNLIERDDVEVFFYNNSKIEDETTKELKKKSKNWSDIYLFSDFNLAKKIFKDNIDILFDLSGFTNGNRLGVFPYRPAKIQISWVGYLNSLGIDGIDYLLADSNVIPELKEFESLYKEKIIRLDRCWTTLSLSKNSFEPNYQACPNLKNNFLTFGSMNNYKKYNEKTLDVWSDILRLSNNTRFYFSGNKMFLDNFLKSKILTVFEKKKIDKSRVIFEGYSERKISLNNYNKIDICLDPFPYTGGTTMLESTFMCVPTLTLAGNTFISRCGYSINKNLKLDEWISYTEDDYISKAVKFSAMPDFILKTKKIIYDAVYKSQIFSSKKLTENFVRLMKDLLKR